MEYRFRQVLSRPDKERCYRIVFNITWDNKREKLATGVSCLSANFSPAARRVVSIKDPDSARLNAKLAGVVAKVEKAALSAAANDMDFEVPKKAAVKVLPKLAHKFYALWQE